MKINNIDFPDPPNRGTSKEQREAAAKGAVNIVIIIIAIVLASFLWNKFF